MIRKNQIKCSLRNFVFQEIKTVNKNQYPKKLIGMLEYLDSIEVSEEFRLICLDVFFDYIFSYKVNLDDYNYSDKSLYTSLNFRKNLSHLHMVYSVYYPKSDKKLFIIKILKSSGNHYNSFYLADLTKFGKIKLFEDRRVALSYCELLKNYADLDDRRIYKFYVVDYLPVGVNYPLLAIKCKLHVT